MDHRHHLRRMLCVVYIRETEEHYVLCEWDDAKLTLEEVDKLAFNASDWGSSSAEVVAFCESGTAAGVPHADEALRIAKRSAEEWAQAEKRAAKREAAKNVVTAQKKCLFCSLCRIAHPATSFSAAQRKKEDAERKCMWMSTAGEPALLDREDAGAALALEGEELEKYRKNLNKYLPDDADADEKDEETRVRWLSKSRAQEARGSTQSQSQ